MKKQALASNTRIGVLTRMAMMIALITVSAYVRIPLPWAGTMITMQVGVALLAGLVLGAKVGMLTQAAYVAIGLLGLPVFSQGGGFGYVLRIEFGYLLGMIAAAWVCGAVAPPHRANGVLRYAMACAAGILSIYLVALPYTALLSHFYMHKSIPFETLFMAYGIAFLPFDALKAVVAICCAKALRRIM